MGPNPAPSMGQCGCIGQWEHRATARSSLLAPLQTKEGRKETGAWKREQKAGEGGGGQEAKGREGDSLKIPRSWRVSKYQQLFPEHKINTLETHALCRAALPAPRAALFPRQPRTRLCWMAALGVCQPCSLPGSTRRPQPARHSTATLCSSGGKRTQKEA